MISLKHLLSEQLDFSGFKMNKTLNPKIWTDDMIMSTDIRKTLLQIANDYINALKVKVKLKDITLTGSLANFNWSKYSDVDLHILVDLSQLGDEVETIKDLLDSDTRSWNTEHDIKIKGYDVELYIQLHDQEHHSSGVYSILNNDWILKPKKQNVTIDKKNVVKKYNDIVNTVNDIHDEFVNAQNYDAVIKRLNTLREKIKKTRTAGLETDGEYSIENIVFKLIRRNNIMGKIKDMLVKAYDKSMTIDEERMLPISEADF